MSHGFLKIGTIEKTIRQTGYAEVDVECAAFICKCGEGFIEREDLNDHVLENCTHTDQVRWNPLRGEFTCITCGEPTEIPELLERDQRVSVKL